MNLLFDLDGTLTDPYEGITRCIVHALTSLGKPAPPPTELLWCIGPPLKSSFVTLLGLSPGEESLAQEAVLKYRERFARVGLYENRVYETIPEVLTRVQALGHDLYVATAKPTIYAEQILEHFELIHFFRKVYGSELDGTRSVKESLIAYILQQESLQGNETYMIGDRKHDMIGARANQIGGIGVSWGYGSREELESSGAQFCIDAPQDLIALLHVDK